MDTKLDLSIALQMLHELARQEGDLWREYWEQVSKLLRSVPRRHERIRLLENELAAFSSPARIARAPASHDEH
jgi:hypothetical protein